ncbi:MAG: signal peptidase I [Bacillota bacterium]|nr:signal peptidase I [Bacillota bacterium]
MGKYDTPAVKERKRGRPYRIAIVLAIIVFLLLAPEVQEGKYMDPTLSDGQVLVVTKSRYSAKRKAPEHDKLVILEKTTSLDAGAKDNITSRVIAVPGDTVEIKNGTVYVNEEEYVTKNGIKGAKGSFKSTRLKGNQVFILSDNRSVKQYDSRNPDVGLVDMRQIKGNVLFRVWPLNKLSYMGEK